MRNLLIATLASQPVDLVMGIGLLVFVAIIIFAACNSGSGSSGSRTNITDKRIRGGFRPIGQENGGRKGTKSTRTPGFQSASHARTGMRGRATTRAVDWITGEKLDG